MGNVTDQVDLTRMKPASRGSPGLWRVGSGRVRRISKSRGSGRVGSGGFHNPAGRVGSGQEIFKISRVGSGWVKTCRNSRGSDRVGSGQDVSKFSRVGSGQLTQLDPTRPTRYDPTREKPLFFCVGLCSPVGGLGRCLSRSIDDKTFS